MKRTTEIFGDRIRMVVAASDNLQGHVNFAKQLVESTNRDIETLVIPDLVRRIDASERLALAEYDDLQSLKARTKKLEF